MIEQKLGGKPMDWTKLKARRIAGPLLSAAIILPSAFSAQAQTPERTIESAQAFLAEVLTKGTSGVSVQYTSNGEPTGDWVWAKITSVNGSGCSTHFSVTSKWGSGSRSFDWSRVSSVYDGIYESDMEHDGRVSVWVQGAIRDSVGDIVSDAYFGVESSPLSKRVGAAMRFLRDKCDTTSKYGF